MAESTPTIYTSCPDCQTLLSPAERPEPGDRAQCPRCQAWMVFDDALVPQLDEAAA